jgi:hypothetical protein
MVIGHTNAPGDLLLLIPAAPGVPKLRQTQKKVDKYQGFLFSKIIWVFYLSIFFIVFSVKVGS